MFYIRKLLVVMIFFRSVLTAEDSGIVQSVKLKDLNDVIKDDDLILDNTNIISTEQANKYNVNENMKKSNMKEMKSIKKQFIEEETDFAEESQKYEEIQKQIGIENVGIRLDLALTDDFFESEDYDIYDYNYGPSYLQYELNNKFDDANSKADINDYLTRITMYDTDIPEQPLILKNTETEGYQTVIINFDGEIVQSSDRDLSQNIMELNENGININEESITNSNIYNKAPTGSDKFNTILIYDRFYIVHIGSLDETHAVDQIEDTSVNFDYSYANVRKQDTFNNIALFRFIGPILMVLGAFVTMFALFFIMMKKRKNYKKLSDQENFTRLKYHLIQQV